MCNSHRCPYTPSQFIQQTSLDYKYMIGVFNLRPKPKLSFVWDVDILFRYFEQQGDNNSVSDKLLIPKHLILLLLLDAHRINTVNLFSECSMVLNHLPITFISTEVLRHSREGKPLNIFEYRSYSDEKSCIISCLREDLTRRGKHVRLNMGHTIVFGWTFIVYMC